jgi:hypothetical protein
MQILLVLLTAQQFWVIFFFFTLVRLFSLSLISNSMQLMIKQEKSRKYFLHSKKGGETLTGYTFRVGYTYCSECTRLELLYLGTVYESKKDIKNLCVLVFLWHPAVLLEIFIWMHRCSVSGAKWLT